MMSVRTLRKALSDGLFTAIVQAGSLPAAGEKTGVRFDLEPENERIGAGFAGAAAFAAQYGMPRAPA
ncbi:hypothetical protein [Neisseria chenwenguii]|uniref:hypothetical protein n=1 Tax=Neisseria chenwenguii TaxID=1853278 RepID=UPI000F507F0D|nr:hypothetical protein [Neisseria chenwenguii]ROV57265.1 hypothetical protein EGS38_00845 [Neisseria chenwenguii]